MSDCNCGTMIDCYHAMAERVAKPEACSEMHFPLWRNALASGQLASAGEATCAEWCGLTLADDPRDLEWDGFHIMNCGISYCREECYQAGRATGTKPSDEPPAEQPMCPRCGDRQSCDHCDPPDIDGTEPTGNPGELGCDCREIETKPGVDPTGGICGCSCHWNGVRNTQCPSCKGTITRDDVPRHGYGPGRCGPAEQPSRQETGGGETCKSWCGKTYQDRSVGYVDYREVFQVGIDGHTGNPILPMYCTAACRDRAKAKAPTTRNGHTKGCRAFIGDECDCGWDDLLDQQREYRAKAKAAEHVVEHMRPLMVSEAGRTLMAKAAEPSAPAAGTLRDAGLTADTMPKEVLAMLYERATDTLIEARQLRKDQVAALEARLAQVERERDEATTLLRDGPHHDDDACNDTPDCDCWKCQRRSFLARSCAGD